MALSVTAIASLNPIATHSLHNKKVVSCGYFQMKSNFRYFSTQRISSFRLPNGLKFVVNSASGDSSSSVGVDVAFPVDYEELLQQAKKATELALNDNKKLMEIEFPTAGLESVPGDGEGGIEMTGSMQLIREFLDQLIIPEKARRTRIFFPEANELKFARQSAFGGASFKLDYLTKPSFFQDFGIFERVKMADRVKPEDELFLVAYPYFNVNEMLVVEELYKEAVENTTRQLIIFNGELDRIRSGYNGSDKHPLEENDEQSESSEDEEFDGVVQADFAFFDPKPADFHGVKTLLQTYLDDEQWDLSGFVDIILPQTTVGTVVKIEDSEDDGLFAVVTALNLERYKDNECIKEVKEFILNVCKDKDVKEDLGSLLGAQTQNVGLLVSQRVVNLPPQLLPPLYDSLFDEVSWATEDEPTEELRKSFHFKYYLIVSKIYKLKNTGQKKKKGKDDEEEVIYIKAEDEIFHKLSLWSFIYPSSIQQPTDNELKNYQLTGLVMAVEANKIPKFRKELHSLIGET